MMIRKWTFTDQSWDLGDEPVHAAQQEALEILVEPGGMVDFAMRELGARIVEVKFVDADPLRIPVRTR